MAGHFHEQVASRIDGKAKAMIVTRSRLHAVRYHLTMKAYLMKMAILINRWWRFQERLGMVEKIILKPI